MRLIALILAGISILAGIVQGQTTRPNNEPDDNTFRMTEAQIRARMDSLNRKSTTQPATQPERAFGIASRRAQYIDAQRKNAEIEARMYERAQSTIAAATAALPKLQAEIQAVCEQGIPANEELNNILNQYDALRAMAEKAGRSTFSSSTAGSVGAADVSLSTNGTTEDPAKRLAAIMAVESHYGPELSRARARVSQLYADYISLVAQYRRASDDLAYAKRVGGAAFRRHQEALKNIEQATAASEREQSPDGDATWSKMQQRYPGVDVRAIWKDAVKDATNLIGADNPKLRELATKFFNDKAAAAMKQLPAVDNPTP
jgi:hypothetical protein